MKNSEREFIEKQVDSILSEGTYSEGKPPIARASQLELQSNDAWEYEEIAKGVLDKLSDDLSPIGINNFAMAMIHVINSGYYGKGNE